MDDSSTDTASNEPWDEATDPDGYTREDVVPRDIYLDLIISMVTGEDDRREDGAIGLTMQVGGHTVSGLVISRAEWISRFTDSMAEAGDDVSKAVNRAFRHFHDQGGEERARREAAGLPAGTRAFVHMKEVRISGADGPLVVDLWRGRLADVTGWSLGSWNARKADPES